NMREFNPRSDYYAWQIGGLRKDELTRARESIAAKRIKYESEGVELPREMFATQIVEQLDTVCTRIREIIIEAQSRIGSDSSDSLAIRMSTITSEAMKNAHMHGCKCDPEKTIFVIFIIEECAKTRELIAKLVVCDEGPGFDPNAVPDCTATENLEKMGGRGTLYYKIFMDTVKYNRMGNCVTMTKNITAETKAPDDTHILTPGQLAEASESYTN
ncbi:ATP-binding protein, partial [Patescibacteria group bacterium]|nr:ATP-binding protein [Patescibacteria group bacterium]